MQDEVLLDVDIRKPSLYRIIYRYVNPNDQTVTGEVTVTPESASADVTQQSSSVSFPSSRRPEFATAATASGISSTFVLNPGRWTFSLKTAKTIYVVSFKFF